MRLVVDTNVLVSAALKRSSWPANVLRWIDRHGGLLKSDATERELFQVLARPRIAAKIPPAFVVELARLFAAAEAVVITDHIVACRDRKDDKFLELAVNGQAHLLISGDRDLLAMEIYRGIPIIDPAAFGRSRLD
jgi:putative PIN family toxin of toxin-antitoxin system